MTDPYGFPNQWEFVYNGLSQRVAEKFNGNVTRRWILDGAEIAEQRAADGTTVQRRFYREGEQRLGGSDAGNYFYTRDHLGSIREVTDSTATVRARYDYDPYGRREKLSGNLDCDFGFTGHFTHEASGLVFTLYRAYDSETGRWLSRDPIGEAGGINVYGYVANNPINLWDPLGLDAEFVLMRDPYTKGCNPRLSAGTMRIFEDGKFMGAVRVNENGFEDRRQGIQPGNYLVQEKAVDGNYKKGTPAITSPGFRPGATDHGHPEGTVLIHGSGPAGEPDSRACLTLNPTDLKLVTEVFNRNKKSTTLSVSNGPEISNGNPRILPAQPR